MKLPHTFFSNKWFTLFLEKPGVISAPEDGPLWILFYDCYMVCDTSLLRLLWKAVKEYKDDIHLVG
jgi:hypothetical protein